MGAGEGRARLVKWLSDTVGVAGALMIVGAIGSAVWGHDLDGRHAGWIVAGLILVVVALALEEWGR